MFKNLFNKETEVEQNNKLIVPSIEPLKGINTEVNFEETITSDTIQKDISSKLEILLKEIDVNPSLNLKKEILQEDLDKFKKSNKEIYDKIKNLEELGLINTPSVKITYDKLQKASEKINNKISEINDEIYKNKKIDSLIKKYSIDFPGFKFVPEDIMYNIKHKYDLYLGESSFYCKEIPQHNLNIITSFKDKIVKEKNEIFEVKSENLNTYSTNIQIRLINVTEKQSLEDVIGRHLYIMHSKKIYEYFKSNFKIIAPLSHFENPQIAIKNKLYSLLNININTRTLSPNINKVNNNLKKFDKKEILDPIAVLEVKGGYIVMTAWDKEAEIPEIKNEVMN